MAGNIWKPWEPPWQAVGPYVPDFVLPLKIAVEVDGYTHFYAFSQRLTVLWPKVSQMGDPSP